MFVYNIVSCDNSYVTDIHLPRTSSRLKVGKADLFPCLIKLHSMKTYGQLEVQLHTFLTSELAWGEWLTARTSRFVVIEKAPGAH